MKKNHPPKNPSVDQYIGTQLPWQQELQALRGIVLECQLTEEVKWRVPCYTLEGKNILLISRLKEYCALSFMKGALLKDTRGILCQPGANTRAARLIRFTNLSEIANLKSVLISYIHEAIELERSGLKVDFSETRELELPEELHAKFHEKPALKAAFEALTPGRRRAYLLHFTGAKQSETRTARIEKCEPRIFDGKGLHDCTCGLSKRLPACDGSHKFA